MTDSKKKVLDWVRSKNPSTMELKMGCKVKWDGVEYVVCGIGKGMLARMYQLAEADGSGVVEHETEDENGRIECENCAVYVDAPWEKILGSDMGFQELDIAIGFRAQLNKSFSRPFCVVITWWTVNGVGAKPVRHEAVFDQRMNLHNQSEEFYKSILPLINE